MRLIVAVLAVAALLQADGCPSKPATQPERPKVAAYQRFVPVPAPQTGMAGVPWTGFFALDTQIGQLCLTTGVYIPEKFNGLPTCEEDLKSNPTFDAR